jgi:hypothetical protein
MNPPPPNILPITGMISTCTNDFKSNPGGSSARRDGRTENLLFSVSNFLRAGKFRLRKRFCFAWDFPCAPKWLRGTVPHSPGKKNPTGLLRTLRQSSATVDRRTGWACRRRLDTDAWGTDNAACAERRHWIPWLRPLECFSWATFDVSPTWGAVQQIIAASFDGARGLVAS